jgi:hypothetical protein
MRARSSSSQGRLHFCVVDFEHDHPEIAVLLLPRKVAYSFVLFV